MYSANVILCFFFLKSETVNLLALKCVPSSSLKQGKHPPVTSPNNVLRENKGLHSWLLFYPQFCSWHGHVTTSTSQHQLNWRGRIISSILGRWDPPFYIVFLNMRSCWRTTVILSCLVFCLGHDCGHIMEYSETRDCGIIVLPVAPYWK